MSVRKSTPLLKCFDLYSDLTDLKTFLSVSRFALFKSETMAIFLPTRVRCSDARSAFQQLAIFILTLRHMVFVLVNVFLDVYHQIFARTCVIVQ